ncbi:SulP family inorganic anion transporter [Hydrogenophaga sp.]|uniref:SulP family inorganic anion transporter n=1 Tax=Hydrogenophaga sp. TaxID=1904254 RepID=UPI00271A7070|nr:sulfate permease [Hydrogenophaga sp.]MDO8903556.1 sulfate permease [Hydrogenophaga sp.]
MKTSFSAHLHDWFPVLRWVRGYGGAHFTGDLTAAAIVTLLLIPQSLAYAMLAGMPAVTGLYASMLPLVVYAFMGSSPVLAVGPAALRSIMSAAAVGAVVAVGGASFIAASAVLALLVGTLLLVMGALRMGFVSGFLSHPVLSGFISASGILIIGSQLQHLLGLPLRGHDVVTLVGQVASQWSAVHGLTLGVGVVAIGALLGIRFHLKRLMMTMGLAATPADLVTKAAPLLLLVLSIVLTTLLGWEQQGLAVVGLIPGGLPTLDLSPLAADWWPLVKALFLPALLISLVSFVESVSVAQTFASRRRERIDPNAEMRGLGAANFASGLTGGFSIGASFSRTVVAADGGGRTAAWGIYTALMLAATALFFTPYLRNLPLAVLAATIVVAVYSLVDIPSFRRVWRYSRVDFAAQALTFVVTLLIDLVSGLVVGVLVSLLLHLWRSSRPHIATVGRVPGTEHYRNVHRHEVETHPEILGLRVDESLYFANARFLEDHVAALVALNPTVKHVVLQCTAVNDIDASALESLGTIVQRLRDAGVLLHLSEVKGPVMDRLKRSDFLDHLTGQVFFTHHQAVTALTAPSEMPQS